MRRRPFPRVVAAPGWKSHRVPPSAGGGRKPHALARPTKFDRRRRRRFDGGPPPSGAVGWVDVGSGPLPLSYLTQYRTGAGARGRDGRRGRGRRHWQPLSAIAVDGSRRHGSSPSIPATSSGADRSALDLRPSDGRRTPTDRAAVDVQVGIQSPHRAAAPSRETAVSRFFSLRLHYQSVETINILDKRKQCLSITPFISYEYVAGINNNVILCMLSAVNNQARIKRGSMRGPGPLDSYNLFRCLKL